MEMESLRRWLDTGAINIFGRPFAGKDTQGKILSDIFGGQLLGGGEILRGSTIPDNIKALMHSGNLIPTADYIRIVLPYLSKPEFQNHPLLLSSVGRWIGEETGVIEALDAAGHPLKLALYLDLPESVVMQRWQQLELHGDRAGRADDNEAVLRKRLIEFREKTLPVLKAYEQRQLLVTIDAQKSREAVTADILDQLAQRAAH